MRVLVADDDPDIRALLRELVIELGHECREAADGAEAWAIYQAEAADTIISDRLMPTMDGAELCRRVRDDAASPYTYFIILTALNDEQFLLTGMQAGADDYLTKPFKTAELEARLIAAQRVTSVHRDLERAVQHQRELLERAQAAEGRYQSLFESVADPILVMDARGRIVQANAAAREVLGYTGEEICRSTFADLVEAPRAWSNQQLARGDPHGSWHGELLLRRTAGQPVPVEARASRVELPSGSVYVAVLRDLTDRRRVEAERLVAGVERARLEGVLLAARTAAHHVNNQLSPTVGYSELLANHPSLPAELHAQALEALSGAQAAVETVAKLQRVTRLQEARGNTGLGPDEQVLDLERSSAPHADR